MFKDLEPADRALVSVSLWPGDLDWIAGDCDVDLEEAVAAAKVIAADLEAQLIELANDLLRDLVAAELGRGAVNAGEGAPESDALR